MELSLGPDVSPATGEHADLFVLANRSGRSCVIEGYPQISLADGDTRLAFVYARGGWPYVTTARPRPVTLMPGAHAYFLVAKYRCDGGVLHRATSIRIRLPGTRRDLAIRLGGAGVSELDYCQRYRGDQPVDPGNRVVVSPIEATLQAALAPPRRKMPRAPTTTSRDSRHQLTRLLGIFREPPSKADRDPKLIGRLRSLAPTLQDPGPERLDSSMVRIAGVSPWGFRIVLAGFVTVDQVTPDSVPEMVGAFVGGEIGAREPAAAIRKGGELAHFQIEPWSIRVVIVVPDGVQRLAFSAPGIRTITAEVHNNAAAFVIRPLPSAPGLLDIESSMIWYGPRGSIVKLVPSALTRKAPVMSAVRCRSQSSLPR